MMKTRHRPRVDVEPERRTPLAAFEAEASARSHVASLIARLEDAQHVEKQTGLGDDAITVLEAQLVAPRRPTVVPSPPSMPIAEPTSTGSA